MENRISFIKNNINIEPSLNYIDHFEIFSKKGIFYGRYIYGIKYGITIWKKILA